MKKNQKYGKDIELERRRRILLSIWAYAYEFEDDNLVSDHVFDAECLKVDIFMNTGNKLLDDFFFDHFDPSTGIWIHKHPELDKLKKIYNQHFSL